MTKQEIEQLINQILGFSQYRRVNENHPLELYLGLNENGYPTLRYNGNFNPIKVLGSNQIEIKQVKTSKYNSILFTYTVKDDKSIFFTFCEDIINKTQNYQGNDGYIEIVNRYNQWKKLFHKNTKELSENEIMGLIGELLFLKDTCIQKYGEDIAIRGWSGPEPTHKDFSFNDTWHEVKTINSSKNSVLISSLEQLDSLSEGKLEVFVLEKMSPNYNGISLNKLVDEVLTKFKFESNRDIFIEKLKNVGYSKCENYDNFVYELLKHDTYLVNKEFPRLKAQEMPSGVARVQYELLLSLIDEYKESRNG